MNSKKKSKIVILDTSAILSGKPINLDDAKMVTTPGISEELKPGGRDYQSFNYLTERGLSIHAPSKESIDKVKNISIETGDSYRLSKADIEIIALALDIKNNENEAIILTDDYSIQNVANVLNIKFEAISQSGITKRFKWIGRCRGCGKKFKENIKICPICGAEIKTVISSKEDIE